MSLLSNMFQNFLSPAVFCFVLSFLAGSLKSGLKIPSSISRYLSLYLMMAIGFKGGTAIAATEVLDAQSITMMVCGIAIGFLQPILGYGLLRLTTKIDSTTAAAVAAHYGSISIVTFATATSFLKKNGIAYEAYVVGLLALMEAPAIFSGLWIAHFGDPTTTQTQEEKDLGSYLFINESILLLLGAFMAGWIIGEPGVLGGFLLTPFQGVLCLFLLDMGLLVAKNLQLLRNFSLALCAFAIYMPLLGACLGLGISHILGVNLGTGMLFMVLCASASYIAVPAALRLALPTAKAAIYVPMSLGLTFPFNIFLGIPLYYALAEYFLVSI